MQLYFFIMEEIYKVIEAGRINTVKRKIGLLQFNPNKLFIENTQVEAILAFQSIEDLTIEESIDEYLSHPENITKSILSSSVIYESEVLSKKAQKKLRGKQELPNQLNNDIEKLGGLSICKLVSFEYSGDDVIMFHHDEGLYNSRMTQGVYNREYDKIYISERSIYLIDQLIRGLGRNNTELEPFRQRAVDSYYGGFCEDLAQIVLLHEKGHQYYRKKSKEINDFQYKSSLSDPIISEFLAESNVVGKGFDKGLSIINRLQYWEGKMYKGPQSLIVYGIEKDNSFLPEFIAYTLSNYFKDINIVDKEIKRKAKLLGFY